MLVTITPNELIIFADRLLVAHVFLTSNQSVVDPRIRQHLTEVGVRLERPSRASIPRHPIWTMVESCHAKEPSERPGLSDLLFELTRQSNTT